MNQNISFKKILVGRVQVHRNAKFSKFFYVESCTKRKQTFSYKLNWEALGRKDFHEKDVKLSAFFS